MTHFFKKTLFIFLLFAFGSCGNETIKKPKNLISQSIMENILYDLAIIDGARIADPQGLTDAGLSQQGFIFDKYKIDSLQFAESNNYYTANIDAYILMYERILKKIETEKILLDTLVKKQKNKTDSIQNNKIDTVLPKKVKSYQVFKKKVQVTNNKPISKEQNTLN